jgi:hypothetical protein
LVGGGEIVTRAEQPIEAHPEAVDVARALEQPLVARKIRTEDEVHGKLEILHLLVEVVQVVLVEKVVVVNFNEDAPLLSSLEPRSPGQSARASDIRCGALKSGIGW